jgi:hypothetical protein
MAQFSSTGSIANTDLNNMLRGYYRDNANHAVTGTTNETDMASTTLTANDLGATGLLEIYTSGTITNVSSGAKTIRLYFGATVIFTVSRTAANAQDWFVYARVSNTATGAQRIDGIYSTTDATTVTFDYTTAAIDTTANVTVKTTGQLVSANDTITGSKFEKLNVQIT